jgi:hypothetical protein
MVFSNQYGVNKFDEPYLGALQHEVKYYFALQHKLVFDYQAP